MSFTMLLVIPALIIAVGMLAISIRMINTISNTKICPQCGGQGRYFSESMARDHECTESIECPMCKGKGRIKKIR